MKLRSILLRSFIFAVATYMIYLVDFESIQTAHAADEGIENICRDLSTEQCAEAKVFWKDAYRSCLSNRSSCKSDASDAVIELKRIWMRKHL